MYSQGETFYYEIEDEEYELCTLENFNLNNTEYVIAEDIDGTLFVFYCDEDQEELFLVDDDTEIESVLDYWREELLVSDDIEDFDNDSYYEKEDEIYSSRYDGLNEIDYDDDEE